MPNGLVEISQMLREPQALVDGPIGVAGLWEVDEDAGAIVLARVASETGAGLIDQVRAVLDYAEEFGIGINSVLGACGVPGDARFHERADATIVEQQVAAGRVSLVLCTDPGRISTDGEGVAQFCSFLVEHGAEMAAISYELPDEATEAGWDAVLARAVRWRPAWWRRSGPAGALVIVHTADGTRVEKESTRVLRAALEPESMALIPRESSPRCRADGRASGASVRPTQTRSDGREIWRTSTRSRAPPSSRLGFEA